MIDRVVHFGIFDVDLESEELRKRGSKIRLSHQPFQVLACILRRPGEIVSRDELRHALWSADTFVDFDMGLSSAVKKLRDALGDSANNPRFVETVPRRGYRFIYPINDSAREAVDRTSGSATEPDPLRRSGRLVLAARGAGRAALSFWTVVGHISRAVARRF